MAPDRPDVPDAWPLVLARVAGLHARRPTAEPPPEAAMPTARNVAGDHPQPLPPPAPIPDALPGAAVHAARPAADPAQALADFVPVPVSGADKGILPGPEATLPAMPVSPDLAPRSDDRLPAPQPEVPPARQIAEAMRAAPGNRVDLTLMPEELGRVTISFQTEGDALRVHLMADRPETLDLLRRHAPELAADLRAQGYDTTSFSFGRSGHPPSAYAAPVGATEADLPAAADPAPTAPRPLPADVIGTLDLRL
jgi:hypothetical protein